jgi:hypothetical protein
VDKKNLLMEQYKIIEERRSFYGKLFWQLPSFFIAVFAIFVSIADKDKPYLFRAIYLLSGTIFLLISGIAYRLRSSQDECEVLLEGIEKIFRDEKIEEIISLPRSKKLGARTATIIALVISGLSLLFFGFKSLFSCI